MYKNILGINASHNSSISLIINGKLEYFIEEERISRKKRDHIPYKSLLNILQNYSIDAVLINGISNPNEGQFTFDPFYPHFSLTESITNLITKFHPDVQFYHGFDSHHFTHAISSFYNSGFEKSAALVIDGSGACLSTPFNPDLDDIHLPSKYSDPYNYYIDNNFYRWETESIFLLEYPLSYNIKYQNYGTNFVLSNEQKIKNNIRDKVTIAKTYEAVTKFFGWDPLEAGKTMGLSSYGNQNPRIPNLFEDNSIISPVYPRDASLSRDFEDFIKRNKLEKDLAWRVQNDTQEKVAELIEKTLSLTGINKICCSGGYFLNCVANYYFVKKFKNVEFFFDPLCYDAGLSLGGSKMINVQSNDPKPLTSLYLGPKYPIDQYLIVIKNNNMFNQYKITPEQVAKLISERNIVTIFQGRSEAGPRALGNRSILYDPTDPNGKDFVNKVKKREWFRPFAGTVLLEKANEWFDMAGLEESPFMMYAMDVWPDKQEQIQAITHVDGTCRIQTVTEEQNPHYYRLIQEFEKITGVPILFNTSFNLAGDPLVETIEDALETMLKSEMKYMYLPELEMLLEKKQ